MKRYVILVLSLFFLLKILTVRLIDVDIKRVCPVTPTTDIVSKTEAEVFLKDWQAYVARGYEQKVPEDFTYDGTDITERLPWIVKAWFEKECIDAKRFYYVEQRLRSALKAYDLKKHTDNVIAVLSAQMSLKMDKEKRQWYEDIIEQQKRMSEVAGIGDEEFEFIRLNEIRIREILK